MQVALAKYLLLCAIRVGGYPENSHSQQVAIERSSLSVRTYAGEDVRLTGGS